MGYSPWGRKESDMRDDSHLLNLLTFSSNNASCSLCLSEFTAQQNLREWCLKMCVPFSRPSWMGEFKHF